MGKVKQLYMARTMDDMGDPDDFGIAEPDRQDEPTTVDFVMNDLYRAIQSLDEHKTILLPYCEELATYHAKLGRIIKSAKKPF